MGRFIRDCLYSKYLLTHFHFNEHLPPTINAVIMTQLQMSTCQAQFSTQRSLEHRIRYVWSWQLCSVFMNLLSGAEYLFWGCLPWAASTIFVLRGTSTAKSAFRMNSEQRNVWFPALSFKPIDERRRRKGKNALIGVTELYFLFFAF